MKVMNIQMGNNINGNLNPYNLDYYHKTKVFVDPKDPYKLFRKESPKLLI